MSSERVVLVIGAGGSVADCMRRHPTKRPPLDRGFFGTSLRMHGAQLRPVTDYLREHYGVHLKEARHDSLEQVMAVLYTDIYGGSVEEEALKAFRILVKVFLVRLANTTNDVAMTSRSKLYRFIAGFLNRGVEPEDLTIITFNLDIQIEKALDAIGSTKGRQDQRVFLFPHCYRINAKRGVTGPAPQVPQFRESEERDGGVTLLKLHGSLNWYSAHRWRNPSMSAIFDPRRRIGIVRGKAIDSAMRLSKAAGGGTRYTFPIVIPPVVHKSAILHSELQPVWRLAEESLKAADRIVILGYSCPSTDWESANLIGRALTANKRSTEISVIDPNPGVLFRYVELGELDAVSYFASCDAYLKAE